MGRIEKIDTKDNTKKEMLEKTAKSERREKKNAKRTRKEGYTDEISIFDIFTSEGRGYRNAVSELIKRHKTEFDMLLILYNKEE